MNDYSMSNDSISIRYISSIHIIGTNLLSFLWSMFTLFDGSSKLTGRNICKLIHQCYFGLYCSQDLLSYRMSCHRHQIWHGDTFKDITDTLSLSWYGNNLFISRRNVWLISTYHFVYNNGIYAIHILLRWPAYLLLSGHWHRKIYSFFLLTVTYNKTSHPHI